MNLLGTLILTVLIAVVLGASRRLALLGMMAGVLYLTQFQQIEVFGLNLYAMRFLNLAGFIRVMTRREFSFYQLTGIDRALLWLYGYTTVVFLLRSTEGQAYQIGLAVDAFLTYFTFRGLVLNMEDYRYFMRDLVVLLTPYVLLVLIESATGQNPFALMGSATGGSNWMRDGHPRCFGSFRQPDTLGMFAASFLPLYISLVCIARERKSAFVGICLCLALVAAANSGGPAAGAAVGLLGWLFWRVRTKMCKMRWAIVAIIVALAVVMKAPIWYLLARASSITGGDGWHRSYLIDRAVHYLGEWWLAGMLIKDTKDWMPYDLVTTGGADITNQYLAFGIAAGLGAIFLFILLLKRAFSGLGLAMSAIRSASVDTYGAELLLWGLGVMLTVHVVNWFGISYFDQMYVVWFMQLAAISSLSQVYLARAVTAVEKPMIETEIETSPPSVGFGHANWSNH